MEKEQTGASPPGSGSRADAPSPSVSASGFDPSREMPDSLLKALRAVSEILPYSRQAEAARRNLEFEAVKFVKQLARGRLPK